MSRRRASDSRRESPASALRRLATGRGSAIIRSWLVFFGLFAAFDAWLRFRGEHLVDLANRGTAQLTAAALTSLGQDGVADGAFVYSSLFSIEVIFECTGAFLIMLFVAAVAATPSGWRAKLVGVVVGVPALVCFNVIRLVTLCYVGGWYPQAFETSHELVWQSLMVFATVLAWAVWVLSPVVPREHTAEAA